MASQDVETATTAVTLDAAPDNKTRRYDRQLRLWAASGQNALESARILVISGSATSTSILKNLVLPGVGHFTILDPHKVTAEDAGNNFFLEGPSSIGKSRAEEAVRLLLELNEGVEGKADQRSLEDVLESNKGYLSEFTIVVAHNLDARPLDQLATLLWEDETYPPLVVVRSAGFVAEVYIQYHEHAVIETHPETPASLRIDKPFPALLDYATSLDFENMDVTDHGHVPYVIILVRLLEDWKKSHNGLPPVNYAEQQEFKKCIRAMRKKADEENFEEAEAQAYRVWAKSSVPFDIRELLEDKKTLSPSPASSPFFHLLQTLKRYVEEQPSHTLPLTSALPDMKSDTNSYIHLQQLYKTRAEEEKATFKSYLQVPIDDDTVDSFVKNAHALKLLRGKKWGAIDTDSAALAAALEIAPKQLALHLALSALSAYAAKQSPGTALAPTVEVLQQEAQAIFPFKARDESPDDEDSPQEVFATELEAAIGELVRAPTADLPNTAALLGGVVAQEVIKMITKQYIPINGSCVIDLVETWTGILQ